MDNTSDILNLETLGSEYDALLLQYNKAQLDYVSFLKNKIERPCNEFNADSKGITQRCYDEIWKQAGCTTTGKIDANNSWAKERTLNELIKDSFLWATMNDDTHINGCYQNKDDVYNTKTEPDYNINKDTLLDIQGQAFWGTGASTTSRVSSSLEECKALCSTDINCTGATFNPDKKYCWTRTGNGNPIPAMSNDYAIIPESVKYLNTIHFLNKRLSDINKQMMDLINTNTPIYEEQTSTRKHHGAMLDKNYKILSDERKKIENLINEYMYLNNTHTETTLYSNKTYNWYVLWLVILLGIVFIAINYITTGSSGVSFTMYILSIILLFLLSILVLSTSI